MRTTVTLDPDVAAKVKQLARERGTTFKETLNSLIRAGLAEGRRPQRFVQKTYPLGIRPGIDMDKATQLAAELEDEEIIRKLRRDE